MILGNYQKPQLRPKGAVVLKITISVNSIRWRRTTDPSDGLVLSSTLCLKYNGLLAMYLCLFTGDEYSIRYGIDKEKIPCCRGATVLLNKDGKNSVGFLMRRCLKLCSRSQLLKNPICFRHSSGLGSLTQLFSVNCIPINAKNGTNV